MKWIVVLLALGVAVSVGIAGRSKRRIRVGLAIALGFLPYLSISINPISYETYRGDARGLEFTLVDFVAVALAISLAGKGAWRRPWPIAAALYVLAAMLSISAAPSVLFALFAVWKILRVNRLLATVAQAGQVDDLAPEICRGLALGLVYCAVDGLSQRYLGGMMQVKGPFSHQNGLGMASNMVFPVCFAMLLSGQGGHLAKAAVAAAALSVVLTLSRGGMVLFAVAATLVFLGSLARKLTGRKLAVLGLGIAGAGAVLLKSWDTIVERFSSAPDASAEARVMFEDAARRMLHDHPAGIGINQFSRILDERYADLVGLPEVDRNGLVHNVYWLTAAEMGYLGIATFLLVMTRPLLLGVWGAFRERSLRGDLMMGLAVGIGVTLVQGKLEWSLRTSQLSFLLAVVGGLVFALHASSPKRRAASSR